MSVRNGLLALLASQEMYGAQLRSEFEARTGGQWPLNIGQVYTTLGRLERDGLVEGAGAADDEGRIPYRLTETGRGEVDSWWAQAVPRDVTPRNELAIKLALAVTMPGVDVRALVSTQRTATMRHLRELNRSKPRRTPGAPSAPTPDEFVLESLIFADEAELRWLDYVEERLARG
ncbi:PadR family transcriptional regulator [Dermacoccus nishinomiyaensis]|uniref:PadR family transcriptional regulator n=1 Tax=Dermacoccus nishinomiyaensis TaxID=1274 RepID=UPI001F513E27|nr:PadR family transcriptional regulator [uncultured Dermacoccus sp.]MCI0153400.1 PadR family transcriptional regulator [Dermacoccus nishinomiyaensis]